MKLLIFIWSSESFIFAIRSPPEFGDSYLKSRDPPTGIDVHPRLGKDERIVLNPALGRHVSSRTGSVDHVAVFYLTQQPEMGHKHTIFGPFWGKLGYDSPLSTTSATFRRFLLLLNFPISGKGYWFSPNSLKAASE